MSTSAKAEGAKTVPTMPETALLDCRAGRSAVPFLGSGLAHAAFIALLLSVTIPAARRELRHRITPVFVPAPEATPTAIRPAPRATLRTPPRAALYTLIPPLAQPALPPSMPEPIRPAPTTLPGPPTTAPQIEIPRPVPPSPVVQTGVFATPTPVTAPPSVQPATASAAFGEATRGAANVDASVHLQVGSFESQSPRGEASTARHKAGAAGFGEARALASPAATRSASAASSAGFGAMPTGASRPPARAQVLGTPFNQVAAEAAANRPNRSPDTADRPTELEILEKPRPRYTDDARRLHIEGDVLIRALFEASGRVRVLQIVRGLGHGLDENAVIAATAIRFRPATTGGQATDTVAVVRIQFQLAY